MMNGMQEREIGLIIKCSKCGVEKDQSHFSFSVGWGYKTQCKECFNAYQKLKRKNRIVLNATGEYKTRYRERKEPPSPERQGTAKTLPAEIIPEYEDTGYASKLESIKHQIKPGDVLRVPKRIKDEGIQMVKARVVEIHKNNVLMEYQTGIKESFTLHEMYKIVRAEIARANEQKARLT